MYAICSSVCVSLHRCMSSPCMLLCVVSHVSDVCINVCMHRYDWDQMSEPDFIGQFSASFRTMMNLKNRYKLINPEKLNEPNYTDSGVMKFQVGQHYTTVRQHTYTRAAFHTSAHRSH